ncbi:MAG TPA: FAD-linked oxidase C-terminal domain-containing protein [Candidatus Binataceae bacterium]|nr:FAD-linked oxidase C-terminal domain-containing protein [Candidatus Binataceae bacterium]
MTPATRALERKLASVIEGDVRFDSGTRAAYSTDASNYRQVPIGVIAPRDAGDIARALAVAREAALPILARGGGTSLAGQAANAALVLDCSKYMNRILAIDPARAVAIVEPGVVQSDLNAALAPHGLFFAPDPSTKDRCTIGGMIGNNSCGAHSAAYGKTVDNLEALDAILYDGAELKLAGAMDAAAISAALERGGRFADLVRTLLELRDRAADSVRAHYPRIPRRVSGYNLDELLPERGFNFARALVGSEGTCAVTTAATLRLVPRPKELAVLVLGFDDVFRAADQMPWMLAHRPEALEGFDHNLPDFARQKKMPGVRFLPEGRAFLVVELGGASAGEARGRAEAMLAEARVSGAALGSTILMDAREQSAVWKIRESGLGSSAYIAGRPRCWPGAEDAAVAPEKLGVYLRRFDAMLTRHALSAATYYGHFGEGCVHARISFDLASAAGVRVFRAAMEELGALVAELGGSLSGEHGDGIARSELLPAMFPRDLIDAFRDFKRAFDPAARMNPGVIVDPHPLDSHLKQGAGWRPREVTTHFDFSSEGGLAGAALKCVGIGKCRKTDAGAMCPSYMATREEKHSTRGRARIILEALTGDTLAGGFTDPALKEALDLCLACKACKGECPSSIDMAAYRAEFFSHYYAEHRRPLAAHFFGRMHDLARAASAAPALANALARAPIAGALARRVLGVHPARELPRFAPRSFRSWFTSRRGAPAPGAREVILFPDTFNNFFEPQVAIAATEVLERAGFRVTIPAQDVCCGRPLYDQGMLERARRYLSHAIDALAPAAERGIPIVGLEPSCILTFRDELPAMFPHDPRAAALGERAMLLGEFLAREAPDFAPPAIAGRALLHAHCHQQAIAGTAAEAALLARTESLNVTVLDAGCCGMAGAFGYSAEHYAVSRAIGERALAPAIRAGGDSAVVVADGFSCRAQIRHLCPGANPMHLAEFLNLPRSSGAQRANRGG